MTDKTAALAAVAAEREAHLARLPLTPAGRKLVLDALAGPPVRRVHGGPANLVSRPALRKSRVTNDTESMSLEFEHLFIEDADPRVVDYRTQAVTLTLHVEEPLPDGTTRRRGYGIFPDVLSIELDRVVLRDLMREDELLKIAADRPWFIHLDPETGKFVCPSAVEAAAVYGFEYEIISSAEHSRIHARGARYLYDFADHAIPEAAAEAIFALVDATPGTTIAELIDEGRRAGWTVGDSLAAVAEGLVFCDLTRHAADDHVHARLYADAATARAYADAHPPSWAAVSGGPRSASIAPGTRYELAGQALELFVCTGDEVHFTRPGEPGCSMTIYRRTDFERLVAAGHLVAVGGATLADQARAGAAAAWAAGSPKAKRLAHERWRALEIWRANREARRARKPVLPLPLVERAVPSERSLERWDAASRESERRWGDVLVGLLSVPRRGWPGGRLDERREAVITHQIAKYHRSPVGRSRKALVGRIRLMCRRVGILDLPDRKTILARVEREDPYKLRRAREGDKAAYPDRPYTPVDPDATPVHGLYPFQRVHYDTTTTDVEVIDPISGRNLGRPGFGSLVDGFSDRLLTWNWLFGGPRAADLLDALVDCAERYGRLPEELILDNATSHWATAIQVFAAIHRIHITYRPKAQGRFGGPVEISFGRITDELFHQIRGNTKAMKIVRTVTEAVDAARLAVLSLAELDYLVELWVEAVEDVRIVKGRGRTPKAAFEQGILEHGRRESRHVVVDDLFRMQALIPAGTRVATGPKGIHVDYITYQHGCFGCAGVKGKKLDVSMDPRNLVAVHAFMPAHYHGPERMEARWVRAVARSLAPLRVVSSRELAIATTAIRERLRDDGRQRTSLELAIAEVLTHAEDLEELALERLRTRALVSVSKNPLSAAPITAPSVAPAAATVPAAQALDDPLAALGASIDDAYLARYQEAS